MSFDGSHIICEDCLEMKFYSAIKKEWLCAKCEIDKADNR